jgi:hypothetical protein
MPRVSAIFSSQVFRARDLGEARSVHITGWHEERMWGEDCYVLDLAGEDRVLRLTSTLARDIAQVLGSDELEDWIDRWVTIYPSPQKIRDRDSGEEKTVDTIRACASDKDKGLSRQRLRQAPPDDDIPF